MSEHTKGEVTIETPCGFPYSGLYIVPVIRKDFPFHIAEIRQLREREESEANAERLVLCWNSHDDLLIACEAWERAVKKGEIMTKDLGTEMLIGDAIELTKAAIAKAQPSKQSVAPIKSGTNR